MKKILVSTAILSLVIFSGCSLFSGKNKTTEENQDNNDMENQLNVIIDDQTSTQTKGQNNPAEKRDEMEINTSDLTSDLTGVNNTATANAAEIETAESKLAKCLKTFQVTIELDKCCRCKNLLENSEIEFFKSLKIK